MAIKNTGHKACGNILGVTVISTSPNFILPVKVKLISLTRVQTLFAAFFIIRIASLIMLSTVTFFPEEPFGFGALKEADHSAHSL